MNFSARQQRPRQRHVRIGDRNIIAEGLETSLWRDHSHRAMTASWPRFIATAALIFVAVNALFADGSVKWVKNTVDGLTWRALHSVAGGEVVSSDSY